MDLSRPILAIDTSTELAGIGLLNGEVEIALAWDAGRNQTTSILDQIDRCLSLASLTPSGIGAIAVAIGPGMFTSLRVGISLAKGLATGLDLPVVGVSTLEVAAARWIGLDREIVAMVAVGRGRAVWQRFSVDGRPQTEPTNNSSEELQDALIGQANLLLVGDLPADLIDGVVPGAVIRRGDAGRRDPLALARIGRERLTGSGPDDLVLLQPTYVHSRSGAPAGV